MPKNRTPLEGEGIRGQEQYSRFVPVVLWPDDGLARSHCRSRLPTPRDGAGKSARADLLRGRRSGHLLRHPGRADAPGGGGGLGLLPDAEPRPSHLDAPHGGRFGEGARRGRRSWANWVNARGRWRGRLFDGRFASVAMDEAHLFAAVRYVSLNPVRAGLVARARDWAWSSVRAHLKGEADGLVIVKSAPDRVGGFAACLEARGDDERAFAAIRAAETTGRALGTADFVADLERRLGRPIAARAPGRKPFRPAADQPKLL